jgi:hypothetical protein
MVVGRKKAHSPNWSVAVKAHLSQTDVSAIPDFFPVLTPGMLPGVRKKVSASDEPGRESPWQYHRVCTPRVSTPGLRLLYKPCDTCALPDSSLETCASSAILPSTASSSALRSTLQIAQSGAAGCMQSQLTTLSATSRLRPSGTTQYARPHSPTRVRPPSHPYAHYMCTHTYLHKPHNGLAETRPLIRSTTRQR